MLNKEFLLTPQSKAPIGKFHFYSASSKSIINWGVFDSDGTHRTGYVWHNKVNSGDAAFGLSAVRSYLQYAFQDFIYKSYPADVYYKDKLVGELIGNGIFKFSTTSGYIDKLWNSLDIVNFSNTTFDKSLYIYLK